MATYSFGRAHSTVGTSDVSVLTVATNHNYIITGLRISNVSDSVATSIRCWVNVSGNVRHLVGYNLPLGAASAVEILEGSKIILNAGDILYARSTVTNSTTIYVSYLDEDNS